MLILLIAPAQNGWSVFDLIVHLDPPDDVFSRYLHEYQWKNTLVYTFKKRIGDHKQVQTWLTCVTLLNEKSDLVASLDECMS